MRERRVSKQESLKHIKRDSLSKALFLRYGRLRRLFRPSSTFDLCGSESGASTETKFSPEMIPSSEQIHLNFHRSGSSWGGVKTSRRAKITKIGKAITTRELELMEQKVDGFGLSDLDSPRTGCHSSCPKIMFDFVGLCDSPGRHSDFPVLEGAHLQTG